MKSSPPLPSWGRPCLPSKPSAFGCDLGVTTSLCPRPTVLLHPTAPAPAFAWPLLSTYQHYFLKVLLFKNKLPSIYYLILLLFIITRLFKKQFLATLCILFLGAQVTSSPTPVGLGPAALSGLPLLWLLETHGPAHPTACIFSLPVVRVLSSLRRLDSLSRHVCPPQPAPRPLVPPPLVHLLLHLLMSLACPPEFPSLVPLPLRTSC